VATKTSPLSVQELWQEYKLTRSDMLRNQLVVQYLHVVQPIAKRFSIGRSKCQADYEEILAAGNFGLIQAVEGFDPGFGVQFETYAQPRILGEMLDWLRHIDWIPRLVRSNARLYAKAVVALPVEPGFVEPSLETIADFLHISVTEAAVLKRDAGDAEQREYVGIPDFEAMEDRRALTPFEELTRLDGFEELTGCLKDRERIIITLYYRDDFTMIRIGSILGCSESCVSQILSAALVKIRDSLVA